MIKKAFLSLASLFLIWYSYGIVSTIHQMNEDNLGLLIFIAWLISLFITGIFAFAGFAFPTQKLMASSYYNISNPRRLKKIYRILKVDLFRKALLATVWRSKKQQKKYFNGKSSGIQHFEVESMKSEFGHLLPFIIINILCVYLISISLIKLAIVTFLFNVIGNLYPIILQRHHRMRISILRKRQLGK